MQNKTIYWKVVFNFLCKKIKIAKTISCEKTLLLIFLSRRKKIEPKTGHSLICADCRSRQNCLFLVEKHLRLVLVTYC